MRSVVRWAVVAVLVVHGGLHLLGVVEGFGWRDVPALHEPVSTPAAVGWLLACMLVLAAAMLLALRRRRWWAITALASLVSQAMVVTSWSDARAGSAVNVVLALVAAYGWMSHGSRSFEAEYARRTAEALDELDTTSLPVSVLTEEDLDGLPGPVADYVRLSGAVGLPHVTSFRATIHGRIRSGPTSPWMPFTGEQVDTFGPSPTRLFHIDATRNGIPVDVLHVFTEGRASMRVRLASALPLISASGDDATRAETVTLFNDLCVLAPAALVGADVVWEELGEQRLRGTFTSGPHSVSAELVFDREGKLADFVSDDRLRASSDGRSFVRQRWSTPLQEYAVLGGRRVAFRGDALWHAPVPEGRFCYLEFHVDQLSYNVHDHGRTEEPQPGRTVATS